MKTRYGQFCACLAILATTVLPRQAEAQSKYPSKPIRFFLGVAPGGLTDVTARQLAQKLQGRLGQPVLVENKPGASTTIGANAARQAPPDGYTLFFGSVMSASPIFVKNQAVDFATQMKPVAQVIAAPLYVLANTNVPAKSMNELIAYAKLNPGKINFADSAPLALMAMSAIADRTGFTFTAIPYKGSAPSLTALIAGEIDMVLDTVPNYEQYIKAGKVRPLMNTGNERSKQYPDVPAGTELKGIDFTAMSVQSIWAPAKTPDAIVEQLYQAIADVCAEPEFRKSFFDTTKIELAPTGPAELLKAVEADKVLYTSVAKQLNYEPQ